MAVKATTTEAGAGLASLHDAIAASDAPGGAGGESATTSKRARGKPTHPVWQLFTAKHEAYKLTNGDTAECLHCREVVRHHNKVLSVVRHLRKCRPFGAIVHKMDAAERPEWLAAGTKRARIKREHELTDGDTTTNGAASERGAAPAAGSATPTAAAATALVGRTSSTSTISSESPAIQSPAHSKQAHLQSPALATSATTKKPAPAKRSVTKTRALSNSTLGQTSSTASSASNAAPVRALKGEHTGVAITQQPSLLLSTQQPSAPVRTSYPIALRASAAVSESTAAADLAVYSSYTCVVALEDATAGKDTRTVQYFSTSVPTAIAGRTTASPPQLIDAVESPSCEEAVWIAQDLARVMQSLDTASLCGAVTSSNTLAHQQARTQLSAERFRSRFFHGCATNGLEMLVASVFGSSSGSGASPSPPSRSAFLAGFTSDCVRIVQCLTALPTEDSPALESDGSAAALRADLAALRIASATSSTCRTLALCFAALQRHATAVRNALVKASRSSAHADAHACIAVVEGALFASTLETARAILEPIDAMAELFVSPRVVLSDVYHAFVVSLPDAFRAITSVSPIEATALVRACETSFNAIAGDAHGLANLLDPRFLGDGMTREVQERVEDLLFSFPAHDDATTSDTDDARQEAIYTQYTEFRVAALAERSKQSFRFQMLRKGRKSALQYWQSDATYWPELQQVALKVFSMAASTAAAAPGSSAHNAVDVAA